MSGGSRFGLLKVQDDSDSSSADEQKQNAAQATKGASAQAKKKRSKKKPKQSMAAKDAKNKTSEKPQQWQGQSKAIDDKLYADDLNAALMKSLQETAERSAFKAAGQTGGADIAQDSKGKKKGATTLSLSAFQQTSAKDNEASMEWVENPRLGELDLLTSPHFRESGAGDLPSAPFSMVGRKNRRDTGGSDEPDLFNQVQEEAERVQRKERTEARIRKELQEDINNSSRYAPIIHNLRMESSKLEKSLKETKDKLEKSVAANKRLKKILYEAQNFSQAKLVLDLEKAVNLKEEFSQQLEEVSAQYEKERTSNSQLKAEIDRLKAKKQ